MNSLDRSGSGLYTVPPMADPREAAKKTIEEINAKISQHKSADPRKDPVRRALRKQLKRAQRRLRQLTPLSLADRATRTQKFLDVVNKSLSDLTKNTKKSVGDPAVHSLRKKMKSCNKALKKIARLQKKQPQPAAEAAKPAAS